MNSMDAKIIEIKSPGRSSGDYVVLGIGNKPINPELPLWQQTYNDNSTTGKTIVRPAAFLLNQPIPAALLITVRILSHPIDEDFHLEGLYGTGKQVLFQGLPLEKNPGKKEIIFRVECLYTPGGFFKMTGKGLFWRITRTGTNDFKELGSVDLEMYWLYSNPYDYFPKGIPVETLREIARVCNLNGRIKPDQLDHKKRTIKVGGRQSEIPAKQWVVKQVVNHCFKRNPPRFDIWRGFSRFTISSSRFAKTLLINQYLNSKNDSNALCNCTDQAGILEYYLKVIGIEEVMVYSLDRFGYLEKIKLVGRGTCNNPYYGTAQGCARGQAVVGRNCDDRTFFENHIFCLLKINGEWRVLDSCIGPYTGSDDKGEYLRKARDANKLPGNDRTKVAQPEDIILPGEPLPKGVCPPRRITFTINRLPGEEDDSYTLSEREVTPRPKGTPGEPLRFLVREWPDINRLRIPAKKGWKLLFKEIVPGKDRVLKTWKLVKDKSTVTIHLYISHIDMRPKSLHQPDEWMSWDQQAKSKEPSEELTKRAGEFHRAENHNFKIHAYFQDISSQDKPFIEQLKARLNRLVAGQGDIRDLRPADDLPAVDSITCSNTNPKIGEKITVKIPVEPCVHYDFYMQGKGLKHIAEYEGNNEAGPVKCLDFITLEGAKENAGNQLVVLAVHEKKLLLNSKVFEITKSFSEVQAPQRGVPIED